MRCVTHDGRSLQGLLVLLVNSNHLINSIIFLIRNNAVGVPINLSLLHGKNEFVYLLIESLLVF